MPRLPDGTVVDHWLGIDESESDTSMFHDNLNDNSLRAGEIIAVYKPSDKKNVSKKFFEYDVLAYRSDGNGASAPAIYRNCQIKDGFGTPADFCRYTPRFTKIAEDGRVTALNTSVYVQCPNGDATKAVIVGFQKHSLLYGEEGKEKEDLGHNLEFEFNGLNVQIDKQGNLTIKRKGPTNPDGTPLDQQEFKQRGQATIIIDQNGGMSFNSGGETAEFINIDHLNEKISMDAGEGIHLGGEDEPLILGATYVNAESQFLQDMSNALQQMQIACTQLATGMTSVLADAGASAAAAVAQLTAGIAELQGAVQTFSAQVQGGKSAPVCSQFNTTR